MTFVIKKNGNPFGSHRVISPEGVLPKPAEKVDNNFKNVWDNEILVNVEFLNIDSASFTQIKKEVGSNEENIKKKNFDIVNQRGKMHNPVTGSGGMFIGHIEYIGDKTKKKYSDLKKDDKIVSLVSLSLTPLKIEEIYEVKSEIDQVRVKARTILFENTIYAKLPDDLSFTLSLAVLDVCGAPAQTKRLVKKGDTIAILGSSGKSGILYAYQAKKNVGKEGKIIGVQIWKKA